MNRSVPAFVVLLSVTVAGLALAPIANALVPTLEQELPLVVDELARGGAVDVPGTACSSECESLWASERGGISGAKNQTEFLKQSRNARVLPRLYPALRTLGTIGLAAGTFELGWRIGTGIRTKVLRIGLPGPPPTKVGPGTGSLMFRYAGSVITLNGSPMPEDGWLYTYRADAQNWESVNLSQGWSGACAYLTGPPSGLTVISGTATNWCYATAPVESYYYPETDLPASSPAEDDTGQPADATTPTWPGQPQSRTDLDAVVRSAVGSSPLLEEFLCYQLNSQACQDPQLESSRDQCELVPALSADPAPLRGIGDYPDNPTDFAKRYTKVPASAFTPYGGTAAVWPTTGVAATVRPSGTKVYLRYGYTKTEGNPITNWGGWGFRHIVAKHGWSSLDYAATVLALKDSSPLVTTVRDKYGVTTSTTQRYTYRGPEYTGKNGALCRRYVVVDYSPRLKEVAAGQPAASMITSYGRKLS